MKKTDMTVLVVGGGGREHAIVKKLSESPRVSKLYCAPGNAGIAALAECLPVKATDVDGMVKAAKDINADLVFVAPDDPLTLGMVDRMTAEGIRAFGPVAKAAMLEGSKVFSKNLMKKYGIPTAAYETFSDPAAALAYIEEQDDKLYAVINTMLYISAEVIYIDKDRSYYDADRREYLIENYRIVREYHEVPRKVRAVCICNEPVGERKTLRGYKIVHDKINTVIDLTDETMYKSEDVIE